MKHLFISHSGITYLIAKQYIADYQIALSDVLFIFARGTDIPKEDSDVFAHYTYPSGLLKSGNKKIFSFFYVKRKSNLKWVERTITSEFGKDTFILYTPNTDSMDLVSVLVTMKNCEKYYLVEEGTGSYLPKDKVFNLYHYLGKSRVKFELRCLLYRRFYILRDTPFSTREAKYSGFVTVSDKSFEDYAGERKMVSCPFHTYPVSNPADVVLSIDYCLVLYYSTDDVIYLFKYLSEYLQNKGSQHIAYKFHPSFYKNQDQINTFRKLINDYFTDAEELDHTVSLESYILSCHADFYSSSSSVGFYVSKYGINCYCYTTVLKGRNQEYDKQMEEFASLFPSAYKQLD
ncbi:MAG: hypothetical protein MJY71_03305 [Bacteroidaceae bacterium]|nr:hypothetical protein [Bacteroidaceae bacterium]